jgi:hypothetical protein
MRPAGRLLNRLYRWSWIRNATLECLPGLTVSQCLALALAQAHIRHLLPKAILDDLAPLFEAADRELEKTGWKDWHKRTAASPRPPSSCCRRRSTARCWPTCNWPSPGARG